jgi:precorrin-6B methylase 2
MAVNSAQELFEHELEDIYYAEHELLDVLDELAEQTDHEEIARAFEEHREETEGHIERVERVFEMIGEPPEEEECEGIQGLIEEHETFVDIGAAEGGLPVQVALAHDHITGGGFDLPPVEPHFDRYVEKHGLGDRLRFHGGDFFEDSLPEADVLAMGHILHDWSLDEKKLLLEKAHEALPTGGALIVYESIIDNERRENAFGLLMSLNMLIETPAGYDYTAGQCIDWLHRAGFEGGEARPLPGPDKMVVARK